MPKSLILVGAVSLAVAGVMLADAPAVVAEEVLRVEWTRQFGTSSDDWVDGVAVDTEGLYVAGVTPGALPGQISAGGADVFVRKYDLDGNEKWTRQFGTTSEDRGIGVAVDTSGVYLTGYTYGALPGYANAGSRDVLVRKYDQNGNEQWTRQFGTTGEDLGIEVAVDTGGVYLTGGTTGALPGQSSAGAWDVWVRKYDLDGNEKWTRQFGSISEDWGPGVAVDAGGLYVTGYTAGALPGQSSAGGLDAWVRKYDQNGNEQWTRQFGTASDDSSAGVAVDTGGAYLVGDTMGEFPSQSSAGSGDVFLRKYDLDGNEQWTHQFGTASHDSGQDMTIDTSGVYLTGHTRGAFPGHAHAGAKDVWVGRYDDGGNEQWTLQFGTASDDWGLGVAVDTTGGMYLTGPTRGALPGHSNAGGLDVFVRKYHADAVATPPLCDGKPATIVGTAGDDVLRGTDGDDVIVGRGGDDLIKGRGGNDTICGKNGSDTLVGGPGNDVLLGGNGPDWVGYGLAPAGVEVDLGSGVATGWGSDRLGSIEFVRGSAFDDHIIGNSAWNSLWGGDGDDLLIGRGGSDSLDGGPGDDDLRGNGGNDTVDGWEGDDRLDGGDGGDLLRGQSGHDTLIGGPGDDRLDGGSGSDWVSFKNAPGLGGNYRDGVRVDLAFGTASTGDGQDTLESVENIIGSPRGDSLDGDDFRNVIRGGDGQDGIEGRGGADHLFGGPDHDHLLGGGGNDLIEGHAGMDSLEGGFGDDTLRGGPDNDRIQPGGGDDSIAGGDGTDRIMYERSPRGVAISLLTGTATGWGTDTFVGITDIWGSWHDDDIVGNAHANEIMGRGGDDRIQAGKGDDIVLGEEGADLIFGQAGNDTLFAHLPLEWAPFDDTTTNTLRGGAGNDLLIGALGNDTLKGGPGDDELYGIDGDDYLDGGDNNDTLDGGPNHDECVRGEKYESCEVIL